MKLWNMIQTMRDQALLMDSLIEAQDHVERMERLIYRQDEQIAELTENVRWMRVHMKVKNDVFTAVADSMSNSVRSMLG